MSLFEGNLEKAQVARSNTRRRAVVIPAAKGKEMMEKIQRDMEDAEKGEEREKEELHQA